MLVSRYGNPNGVLSTEHDLPKPRVPTGIVRYQDAHLKIGLAANGCVEAYDRAMQIVAKGSQKDVRNLKPCTPTFNGWTIVGYFDMTDNQPVSAETAQLFLKRIRVKRTLDPATE